MNVNEAMAIGRKEKPDWYFNANEAAPILTAEVERLRAELAAAKAASVVPVEIIDFGTIGDHAGFEVTDLSIDFRSEEDLETFSDWLRERMKGGE